MFICEICKKNQATVHLTDIHENQKQELHLCQGCAEAKGITFQNSFSLPDLLSGLTKQQQKQKNAAPADPVCPECGLHFTEFQARGRFGCTNDYQAFRKQVMPMIERIHGRTRHVGKTLGEQGPSQKQQSLAELQRQMREAVEQEAYEDAARLRDDIAKLKQEINNEH